MATRDDAFAPGTPCWVDLMTSDPDRAKAFYTALMGWTVEETSAEYGNYVNFNDGGHLVAGMMANTPGSGIPDVWSTYLCVEDVATSVTASTEAGATVLIPTMQVGEVGTMAVIADPAGAAVGLWQPGQHTGFGKYNEPNSVGWDELLSKDFPATREFYGKVFGWTYQVTSDTDDFRYVTGQIDGQDVAGMMDAKAFLPDGVPSHWSVYFAVTDIDATCAKLTELGGTVLRPPEDTPFGRIADVSDPTGAPFKLHSPLPQG